MDDATLAGAPLPAAAAPEWPPRDCRPVMDAATPSGLCGQCAEAETLASRSGSRFLFCGRARSDPRYAKYPPLPVYACQGFRPRGPAADGQPGQPSG